MFFANDSDITDEEIDIIAAMSTYLADSIFNITIADSHYYDTTYMSFYADYTYIHDADNAFPGSSYSMLLVKLFNICCCFLQFFVWLEVLCFIYILPFLKRVKNISNPCGMKEIWLETYEYQGFDDLLFLFFFLNVKHTIAICYGDTGTFTQMCIFIQSLHYSQISFVFKFAST